MAESKLHNEKLVDDQAKKIGEEVSKLRGKHLELLGPVEDLCRKLSPLPVSYDVIRLQPPFFNEFTYCEMLGGFYVCPQSAEASARLCDDALYNTAPFDHEFGNQFDPVDAIFGRGPNLDKYTLNEEDKVEPTSKVVFLPGTNILYKAVRGEYLHRLMFENDDMIIKPHPLTHDEVIRLLSIDFGYHRVVSPKTSGWKYLIPAEDVYVSSCTELGLYAILMGKRVHNIGDFYFEPRGAFTPFYRLLWNQPLEIQQTRLKTLLRSPLTGFFHPNDPDLEPKMKKYFEFAMMWREAYKPLLQEITPMDWGAALVNKGLVDKKGP